MKTLYCFVLCCALISCQKKSSKTEVINNAITPNDYLSESKYDKLIIEIDYVSGFEPTANTIQKMSAFLQNLIHKSGGITIVKKAINSPGKSFYTLSDIQDIERGHREQQTNGQTLTVYILFLDNDYALTSGGSSKVLGVNYSRSSIAIFEKTIRDYSGGLTQPSIETLESVVCHHEFGHVLGLTNNQTALQSPHEDANHPAHCNNENCLMYYAVETSDIVKNLLNPNSIPSLDQNCLNDLKANGGK